MDKDLILLFELYAVFNYIYTLNGLIIKKLRYP
jgi:hypothetical protein